MSTLLWGISENVNGISFVMIVLDFRVLKILKRIITERPKNIVSIFLRSIARYMQID